VSPDRQQHDDRPTAPTLHPTTRRAPHPHTPPLRSSTPTRR
jgi:hypothetical protein